VNKNSTLRQRLRRYQRSRLELSAGRTPSFIADGCSVCQAFENSLIFVTELTTASEDFYFALYKVLIMAALRSRCGHYIFALWFLSSIYLLFLFLA